MDTIEHLVQDLEHFETTNPLFYSNNALLYRANFDNLWVFLFVYNRVLFERTQFDIVLKMISEENVTL